MVDISLVWRALHIYLPDQLKVFSLFLPVSLSLVLWTSNLGRQELIMKRKKLSDVTLAITLPVPL